MPLSSRQYSHCTVCSYSACESTTGRSQIWTSNLCRARQTRRWDRHRMIKGVVSMTASQAIGTESVSWYIESSRTCAHTGFSCPSICGRPSAQINRRFPVICIMSIVNTIRMRHMHNPATGTHTEARTEIRIFKSFNASINPSSHRFAARSSPRKRSRK